MEKHLTATAYLVAKIDGKIRVLLHRHKKINIWLGVGGHVERDENPIETVRREVFEEAGTELDFLPPLRSPLIKEYVTQLEISQFIFEFKISARPKEPAHRHIDLVFIGTVKHPEKVKMTEEFHWFSASELKKLALQEEVTSITQKALTLGKKYL